MTRGEYDVAMKGVDGVDAFGWRTDPFLSGDSPALFLSGERTWAPRVDAFRKDDRPGSFDRELV